MSQGLILHRVISAALSPYGSAPQALAESEVALLCSSPLLLLYSSLVHLLNLDPRISHLVRFSNTKSYCLLWYRVLGGSSASGALCRSSKGPSALLASAGAFGAAFVPDRGTARIFFSRFALSNHNPELSHGEPTLRNAPILWQGWDLGVPLAIYLFMGAMF